MQFRKKLVALSALCLSSFFSGSALADGPAAPLSCAVYGMDPDMILQGALIEPLETDTDIAALKGCLKWALDNGAHVNGQPVSPSTDQDIFGPPTPPLILAVQDGNAEIVQMLVDKGASLNAVDDHGFSPLARAAIVGVDAVTDALIKAGAKIDSGDRTHANPLLLAVNTADAHAVRALLDHGADVNAILDLGTAEDNLETALDASTMDLMMLQDLDQERRAAGNDADKKLASDAEIEVAQKDHSPTPVMKDSGAKNLRSFESILADQARINAWLKAVNAKCATDTCGGALARDEAETNALLNEKS